MGAASSISNRVDRPFQHMKMNRPHAHMTHACTHAGLATKQYWTIEGPVAAPTGEGVYHWCVPRPHRPTNPLPRWKAHTDPHHRRIPIVAVGATSPARAHKGASGRADSRASTASVNSNYSNSGGGCGGRKDDGFRGEVKVAIKVGQRCFCDRPSPHPPSRHTNQPTNQPTN